LVEPTPEQRQVLRRSALFARLPDHEIDAILKYAAIRRYAANAQIVCKGDPGSSMMAVLRGRVVIRAPSSEGKEVILNIRGGDFRRDRAARRQGAYGRRDGDERLRIAGRRAPFAFVAARTARHSARAAQRSVRTVRRTTEQLEDVLFLDVEARIAKILLRLRKLAVHRSRARVVLGMSQRELGNLVGASREKVNRRLRAWRLAGIIAIEKGTIFIRDPAALQISQTDLPRQMSW
jgi:CRP-like cAMP-binding protein